MAAPILLYLLFNLVYALWPCQRGYGRIGWEEEGSSSWGTPFCPYRHRICFYLSLWGLIVLFALYGLVYALVDGSGAYISDLCPAGLERKLFRDILRFGGVASIISACSLGPCGPSGVLRPRFFMAPLLQHWRRG